MTVLIAFGASSREGEEMKKGTKIIQVKDGQWFIPKLSGHRLVCCNCGLQHDVDFKIYHNGEHELKLAMRAYRLKTKVKR